MNKDEAAKLLDSLRWREDMVVVNDFDERVWLKPCLNEAGVRVGITDCCFANDPCERHKAMAKAVAIPYDDKER